MTSKELGSRNENMEVEPDYTVPGCPEAEIPSKRVNTAHEFLVILVILR